MFFNHFWNYWKLNGSPIRGFILSYKRKACFLWKIIWFLFNSMAESLLLIMKNNIIHMASTATFTRPCSFNEIFHYIFIHLGLYFANDGTNLLFEILNWLRSISINLIFHVTPKKKSLEGLNRMILAANFNRRFEKSLGHKNSLIMVR